MLWGGIAGFLKARFNANEIIVTIMMNYLGILLIGFLVTGPMKDTSGLGAAAADRAAAWQARCCPS